MAILAGVAALALPQLKTQEMTTERQAALVVDQLRAARRLAIETGSMQQVTVDDLAKVLATKFAITAGPDGKSQADRMIFYPLGNSNGGSWTLGGQGSEMRIMVDWISGRSWSAPQR